MKIKNLFIASKNTGKIEEIRSCLNDSEIELMSYPDFPNITDVDETGTTFEENAWQKARAVYDIVQIPVIADDSGIEVDFLNGAPGVYSSRYAGENATDDDNCAKLLKELDVIAPEKRGAQFKCVVVYYNEDVKKVFEGICKGKVINGKRGTGGFGYDPLFVPDGYSKTYAELEPEIKNKISHRGKALELLKEYLKKN